MGEAVELLVRATVEGLAAVEGKRKVVLGELRGAAVEYVRAAAECEEVQLSRVMFLMAMCDDQVRGKAPCQRVSAVAPQGTPLYCSPGTQVSE